MRRWLGIDGWVRQFYPYIIWFHGVNEARYDYDLAELAALPGVQVEAVLEDGVVFKAVGPSIGFHVSYDKNENKLIYVRENCRAEDLEARFFLHVFPVDPADLPEHRRQYGYYKLDVDVDRQSLPLSKACVAISNLPDHPIARIRTGQFTDEGQIWRVWLHPSDAAEPRPSYQQIMADGPIIRADFDVYLDDYSLIYVKEGCRAEDLDAPVFLHVFPMDKADLPDSRRRDGFEHLDFHLGRRVLYLDGRCISVRDLPDYPIGRIHTGQFIPGQGRLWTSEFSPD